MKNWIIILFIAPILGYSQIPDHFGDYQFSDSTTSKFGTRIYGFNNSDALTATALNSVFYGGFIDEDEKQHMTNRAQPINTSGSILNSSVYYAHRIDSFKGKHYTDLSVFVNMTDRQENLAVFSDHALNLVLNGNKQFAGQSVSLAPLAFNQFRYNQFQVGLTKDFPSGNGISVGASFIYGQNNRMGEADRLDLLTSKYGDRISLDAELDISETNPNNNHPFAYNGSGASVDIQGRFVVQLLSDSSNPGIFKFSVTDFGFIQWNGDATHTKVDTFYSYRGTYIENVFDPNSTTSNDPSQIWDSLSVQKQESYSFFTPVTLHFCLQQNWRKMEFNIGGIHRARAYFHPYFYSRVGYEITPSLKLYGQLNYGGYGKLGGGMEVQYEAPHWLLQIGSTNLEGFIQPQKWGGQNIYIQAAIKL